MKRFLAAAAVLAVAGGAGAGRSNEWPSIFTIPEKTDTAADSARVHCSSDAKVFENTEKTNSRLDWSPQIKAWQLRQRCIFATSYDRPYGATNQLYDFTGSIVRDSVLFGGGSLGLQWTPVSYLNLRPTGGGFQTTGDFGPVMQWHIRDVPIRLRGGISGSGWNSSLPPHLIDSRIHDFHGDAGFYGACSVGDPKALFLGRPVFITADAFVRSVSEVGVAVINGSALFAHGLGSGDSVFAFYGDSLVNGKERYWGSTGSQQQYINTPWRIARSMQASGGLKFRERRFIQPAVIFSFNENSVAYPTLPGVPSDVRTRLRSLNLLAESRDSLPLVYRGGIRIWWGTEAWLFRNDLSAAAMALNKTSSQIDSLTVKLNDHDVYRAATDHSVAVRLPRGIAMEYRLGIFRDSRTYTFEYAGIRKNSDDDAITFSHHLSFTLPPFRGLRTEVFGEYSTYTLNYLKKEYSAANQNEDGYCLGMNLAYQPSERFSISERITADAEIFDYFYTQSHLNDPPPYKRRFASLCRGAWKISTGWELTGRWDESYYDDGVWNGHEYFDSTRADSLGTDCYAIKNKTTDYSVELGLARSGKHFRIEGGCRLQDIFARSFSWGRYISIDRGIGYLVEPFTEMSFQYRRFFLKGRVVRMVNTMAADKWSLMKNWDIHLAGQAAW